jgi:amidophosphoribosyltransferase
MNGISVYDVRRALGYILAEEHPADVDKVIPVPDSGRSCASPYARKLNIKYSEGLMKNRYIGRTFIEPSEKMRETHTLIKLNPIKEVVKDRRVAVIDDSIVRALTSKKIVALLKEAGAKEVHIRIGCPPLKYPCVLGIDFPSEKELIASTRTIPEICKELGADSLGYISIEGLVKGLKLKGKLCLACLNGEYPNERIKEIALAKRKERRLM